MVANEIVLRARKLREEGVRMAVVRECGMGLFVATNIPGMDNKVWDYAESRDVTNEMKHPFVWSKPSMNIRGIRTEMRVGDVNKRKLVSFAL